MADALSVIPAAVLRNLSDKLHEKRTNATLEEGLWKSLLAGSFQFSTESQMGFHGKLHFLSPKVAMAMAAKAKLLLCELKTVKADLAFAKDCCGQLEEENRILRESLEKGDNPEDEDLDEYIKAYYADLLQRQREQDEAAKREQELSNTDISNVVNAKSDRQVGSKSKRDDYEEDEDIEWEEAAPAGTDGSKNNSAGRY